MLKHLNNKELVKLRNELLALVARAKLYVIGLPVFDHRRTSMLCNFKDLEDELREWKLFGSENYINSTKDKFNKIKDYLVEFTSR